MMKLDINWPAKTLVVLIVLFIAGCAEESPKTFTFDEPYPRYQYHSPTPFKAEHKKPLHTVRNKVLPNKHKKKNFNENDLIWDRLLSLYALPEIDHPRIDRELDWYLDHPDYIARVQQRAEPYLYQILNEIEEKNIPGEMALLPIVESAFRPDAVSSASAAGLWQFMPATAQLFGLELNHWYDGRRDVYRSTQAAASYLKDLSETFNGDWLLALASYNYGKGNVQKAIDRNYLNGEPTDYWSLQHLPQETLSYVPKLLAIAKLFAHADEYNVSLKPIRNKPVFEIVDVDSPLDLNQAAEMANTNTDHFMKLNPGYKNGVIPAKGPSHLLIPVAQVDSFKKRLERLPEEQRELMAQRAREEEERIIAAKRAQEAERQRRAEEIRLAKIAEEREQAERQARIEQQIQEQKARLAIAQAAKQKEAEARKGKELRLAATHYRTEERNAKLKNAKIYLASADVSDNPKHTSKSESFRENARSVSKYEKHDKDDVHVNKKGESTSKFAQNQIANPKTLRNKDSDKSSLSNQKAIGKSKQPQIVASNSNASSFQKTAYVVKKGDSLEGIAKRFNVSVPSIKKLNADKTNKDLKSGSKLKIVSG